VNDAKDGIPAYAGMTEKLETAVPATVRWMASWSRGVVCVATIGLSSMTEAAQPASTAPPSVASAPSPATRASDPKAYYHFLRGYQAELSNDVATAQAEYQKALARDADSAAIHLRLATLAQASGDHEQAQVHADAVLAQDAGHLSALHILAAVAGATGRVEQALGYYERITAIRPQDAQPYYSRGMLLAGQKRYAESETLLHQGIALSPLSAPTGYLYLGHVLVEQKAWDRAAQAYRDALAINPGFGPASLGLAATLEAQGDVPQAIATLNTYLQTINRSNRDVRHRLVRLLLTQQAYEPALVLLRELVAESPGDAEAQLRIGLIYGDLKVFPKAVEQLQLVLTLRPNELRVRAHLGYLYEAMQENEKAIAEYDAIIQSDGTFRDAHVHLGRLLSRLKRPDEAVPHFRQALALNPALLDAVLMLGVTLMQVSRHDEAAAIFRDALQRHLGSADLRFNLGTAYDKLGRFDDMVGEMREAIRLDPAHADALNYLGYTFAERDMSLEEAVALIQRALAVTPQSGAYLDSLAWAYFKLGRLDEALETMQKAMAVAQDDPVMFEHLGDIYLSQNMPNEARDAWLRALALDPANRKLMDRFKTKAKELGKALEWADPATDERIRKAQHKSFEDKAP